MGSSRRRAPSRASPTARWFPLTGSASQRFPQTFMARWNGPRFRRLRIYDTLHVLDFGPLYRPEDSSGIITREPPQVGSGSYGVLEMQVDADGNDLAGNPFGLPADADRHVHWLEPEPQRPFRERHVQFARELHSFRGDQSRAARRRAIRGFRSRSAIPRRRSILPLSRRPPMISSRSAFCCRTMRICWLRPSRARAFGTLREGQNSTGPYSTSSSPSASIRTLIPFG